jgi:SAM-dependent methyltransferase
MDTTLTTYNAHARAYAEATGYWLPKALTAWLSEATKELPRDAAIFEIGSGHGRDALFLKKKGYSVTCSDASAGFRELLKEQGLEAQPWDARYDSLPPHQALILANAVLLHLSRPATTRLLAEAYRALPEEGRFAFTLKRGLGEGLLQEKVAGVRHYTYWMAEELQIAVRAAGFEQFTLKESGEWLQCVAHKRPSLRPKTLFQQALEAQRKSS